MVAQRAPDSPSGAWPSTAWLSSPHASASAAVPQVAPLSARGAPIKPLTGRVLEQVNVVCSAVRQGTPAILSATPKPKALRHYATSARLVTQRTIISLQRLAAQRRTSLSPLIAGYQQPVSTRPRLRMRERRRTSRRWRRPPYGNVNRQSAVRRARWPRLRAEWSVGEDCHARPDRRACRACGGCSRRQPFCRRRRSPPQAGRSRGR